MKTTELAGMIKACDIPHADLCKLIDQHVKVASIYRYLITTNDGTPFLTHWFQPENHFCWGMTVYNLEELTYTMDGLTWNEILEDHL